MDQIQLDSEKQFQQPEESEQLERVSPVPVPAPVPETRVSPTEEKKIHLITENPVRSDYNYEERTPQRHKIQSAWDVIESESSSSRRRPKLQV